MVPKDKWEFLAMSLVIKENPAPNENKHSWGEKKHCDDSLQATEGIQLDQRRRQQRRYTGPQAGFRAANVEKSLPRKVVTIWAARYPAAVKAQRP